MHYQVPSPSGRRNERANLPGVAFSLRNEDLVSSLLFRTALILSVQQVIRQTPTEQI